MEEYRLDVKKRLEKPFKANPFHLQRSERDWRKLSSVLDEYEYSAVVASQMSMEQKIAKLEQLYEEELAAYRTVIRRLINFANG
ncbi:unnamed protein product [Brugia timori]|uniref:V-type ATP synthase subunit D n=1 Tax=Brugia timori TaxID=42155 RepID=A0A0R3QVZ8_9BILA|nr:unnamed protein product [Brugia timori]